jgi:predicted dehydrogenase
VTLAIAVVGLGRAGRARVRALEGHPRARLAAIARRAPGPGERAFDDVVRDAAIDAAIVCTPNLLHEAQARALLEAGKHVAVEFPLAAHTAGARELLALARARDRVLHAEHIELLSASQRSQRQRAAALGRPLGGALRFTASSDGWIGEPALAGSPALCALARLSRLVDLFGEADVASAALEAGSRAWRLEVELAFRAGGRALLVEERGPGIARATRWALRCEGGALDDPAADGPGEPFRADLDAFLARIERGAAPYVSDARVLHLLDLVGQIEARV